MTAQASIIDRLRDGNLLAQALRDVLGTPDSSGNVPCPNAAAHENGRDDHPSLHLYDDGRAHCFVCKLDLGVLDAVVRVKGLEGRAEAAALLERTYFGDETTPKNGKAPTVVGTFVYQDEDGEPLYRVLRKEPGFGGRRKSFVQEKWNGSEFIAGKGCMDGVKRVPYRLPDLVPSKYVFLVEGEAHADALIALGLCATSIVGGANAWLVEYAEHFKGKKVCTLPDNDDPGRAFAVQAAEDLHPVADHVRIVELPGLPPKGDIIDWLAAGGTREKLLELARAVDPWEPPTDAGTTAEATMPSTVDDLLRQAGLETLGEDPDLGDVETVLRALGDVLVDVDPLGRATAREAAVQALGRRKIKGAAKLVDAAIGTATRDSDDDRTQGKALVLSIPEPASDPVDGPRLLDEIHGTITRYVVMPASSAVLTATWVLMTYVLDAIQVAPILGIVSPEKRCGKTTLLGVLQGLVAKPLPASSITAAALFRAVEAAAPTLLVDEADTFLKDNDELRGVLNAGHSRMIAHVIRTAGDDHEPRLFSVWCAKAIALIGKLPTTLEDRSILIRLRRRAPGEKVERLRLDRLGSLEKVRARCVRWAEDHFEELRDADPGVPEVLHDRAQDNVRGLLAIADLCGNDWPTRVRAAAIALHDGGGDGDGSNGVKLLHDIREMFTSRTTDRLTSEEIVETLGEMEERPWSEWGRSRKPITKAALARLLRPFSIIPGTIRPPDGKTSKGYYLKAFKDAFSRYLPPSDRHNVTPIEPSGIAPISDRHTEDVVTPTTSPQPLEPGGMCRCDALEGGDGAHTRVSDPSEESRL